MDDTYIISVLASPPKILGQTLKPLSLGHIWLLSAIRSPFIYGGDASTDDLLTALSICSKTFEEAKQYSLAPSEEDVEWAMHVGEYATSEALAEAVENYREYFTGYNTTPERFEKTTPEETSKRKTPWFLYMGVVLMKELNISNPWDIPLVEASSYYAVLCDINGDESLVSEEEKEILDKE